MAYPIMLNIQDRLVVVIGGGLVAERKVSTLLTYGARILLISPELTSRLRQWMQEGKINVQRRSYQRGDLEGAFLVFAATDHPQINRQVVEEAVQQGQLVNVVDQPDRCSFLVPAIVRRGKLQISVSTTGTSPALARRIRQELEALYDEAYVPFLEWMGELRKRIQREIPDRALRERMYRSIAVREVEWLERIRGGTPLEVLHREVSEWLNRPSE